MGRFAVIGLGNFGSQVARVLHELGQDVICLDQEENRVNAAQEYCSYGLVGEATDQNVLSSLQIKDIDAVFVSMGSDMAGSILVTLHLRDLGAKRIIVKILSQEHGRILSKVGAHEIVYPERDMAVRVATYVSSPTIMNYLDLDPEFSLLEVVPLPEFIGQTLADTNIRREYGVNVIGIKDILMDKIVINPRADYVIKDSDALIVIGHREDLARLTAKDPAE